MYATVSDIGGPERCIALDLATGKVRESNSQEMAQVNVILKPAELRPFDSEESSRVSSEQMPLKVVNESKEALTMNLIEPEGGQRAYRTIGPGDSYVQDSFVNYLWVITDAHNEKLAMVRVPSYASEARITGAWVAEHKSESKVSPDGKTEALFEKEFTQVKLRTASGERVLVTAPADEHFKGDASWSPDCRHLVVFRSRVITPRKLTLIESSPADQLQPKTSTQTYVKPGDTIEQPMPHLFDVDTGEEIAIDSSLFSNPWEINAVAWSADSKEFTFVYNQRGHQIMRIIGVDSGSGAVRMIHEESSKTFLDYSDKTYIKHLPTTREIIWMSECSGWNHLYLIDEAAGHVKQPITGGAWNVRSIKAVDVEKRTITFAYCGRAGQDPYFIHFARVNFDGTGFVALTEANGNHQVEFSQDGNFLIDTWSRVDQPPVSEIRRSDTGALVAEINRCNDAVLRASGWTPPEPFVAKGRDGTTDIYGIIIKPSNFDPQKKYPVIENIYAGPQGAFVPKSFFTWINLTELAELGFIIVQVDGMGTNWRNKEFHDVAFKNLADAGLPDRIAWIKSAATTRPWMDLTRVGVFGSSAGGQNALSALLHHGDFYKAGVSAAGCHDNRMDKIWWNEAWMGWPVDESYVSNSNVTDAAKLQGKLMLVVGELDDNVDPASTLQVVNALQKANKDFDLIFVTGVGHFASETPYASRRRADFFVKNLLGVEPRSTDQPRLLR